MSDIPIPKDCMGNEIVKDGLYTVQVPFPLAFKVLAVEHGGIHTANGMTPAKVRLYADITLRQMPGLPFVALLRVVSPSDQSVLEQVMDTLPKG
jgi:hypothetical protein